LSATSSSSSTRQQQNYAATGPESIVDARAEIEDLLEASLSLKTELARDVERQTQRAIDLARRDLRRHEEIDAPTVALLQAASYTEEQVLGDWFPEEPAG
jgi:hypothetical protein